jgi:ketosteroid isomerase-like protein
MSQENVEIVRHAYDALNGADWDWAVEHVHPDCVYTFHAGPNAGTYRGLREIQAVLLDLTAAFDAWISEPLEFFDDGDKVVAVVRHRLRPKGGTAGEFEFRNGHVWTIRDGVIVSMVGFPDRDDASKPSGCGSRAMSQENVEVVSKLVALTDGVDIAAVRDDAVWAERSPQRDAIFAPDCAFMWIAPGGTVGLEATGLDGLRERQIEFFEAWETMRTGVRTAHPGRRQGDRTCPGLWPHRGSQNEVENIGAGIYFVRDGRITRAEFYANRSDALEAAGLRE